MSKLVQRGWHVSCHASNNVTYTFVLDGRMSRNEMFLELDRLMPAHLDYRVEILRQGGATLRFV